MLALDLLFGETSRSHTAYTYFESNGSAVIDSLSLNAKLESRSPESRIRVAASLHVAPPFADLLTVTAFVRSRPSNAIAIWFPAVVGGASPTGRQVRSKSPPFATVPPEQNVNLAKVVFQVAPPSVEYPVAKAARAAVRPPILLPDADDVQRVGRVDGNPGLDLVVEVVARAGCPRTDVRDTPRTGWDRTPARAVRP